MKVLKPLLFIILIFTGFRIFKTLSTANVLDFKILGFKATGDLLNLKLDLQTEIYNKTDNNIKLNSYLADVYLDNHIIGQVNYNSPTQIVPGNTIIELPVFLKPLHTIINLLPKLSTLNLNLFIDGVINFEGVNIPVEENVKLL